MTVAPVGFGGWAIGGPAFRDGVAIGWGEVDDDESVAAIHAALDAGITFIDTAPGYGAGHSERVIGRAIAGRRDAVVLGTKFGVLVDEERRTHVREDASPDSVRAQCEESLRRLGVDVIDLFQFHLGRYDPVAAEEVVGTLESLVDAGKIRAFGWSTDDPDRVAVFAKSPHCAAAQIRFNLVEGNSEVAAFAEAHELAAVIRSPLGMGALTGKYSRATRFSADDVRARVFDASTGRYRAAIDAAERVRSVLVRDGRTLAQGALCWLLARSSAFVPIPGIRTVAQARENAGALAHGPLQPREMAEIDAAIGELRSAGG